MWTEMERDAPVLSEFLGPVEPSLRALLESYEQSNPDSPVVSHLAM